jgi:polyhydroxyalkanoate synthesis regulator phasin
MSENSKDIIAEYKEQIRILREEVAELQDAGKVKDAANKRCLQKLENTDEDLQRTTKELDKLKKQIKELKEDNKLMVQLP